MRYFTFEQLKEKALKCKARKIGRLINSSLALFYNESNGLVELKYRPSGRVLITTNQFNKSHVLIPPTHIFVSRVPFIYKSYGIGFLRISGLYNISEHQSHFIVAKNGKFIYTPGQVTIYNGDIINIDDYYKTGIDKEWNNKYTQTSKRNRAAFTALNNIVPFQDKEIRKRDAISNLFFGTRLEQEAATLVMTTPKPNANDLYRLRDLLRINTPNTKLRKYLQKIVNNERNTQAKKVGKLTIQQCENTPR